MDDMEYDAINIEKFSVPLNLGSPTTPSSDSNDKDKVRTEAQDEFVVLGIEDHRGEGKKKESDGAEGEIREESRNRDDNKSPHDGEEDSQSPGVDTSEQGLHKTPQEDDKKHGILTGEEGQQVQTGRSDDEDQVVVSRVASEGDPARRHTHTPAHHKVLPCCFESSRYTMQTIQTAEYHEDDDDSDSESSDSASTYASHMSQDSEDGYELVRTLRHYRRRRHRSSDSSTTDSRCSCESCASKSNTSFFGSEEGPPGGEATIYRRAVLWLESIKYLWGLFIYGMLAFATLFTVAAVWAMTRDTESDKQIGNKMLTWALPMLVVVVVVIIVWRAGWWLLLRKGYGKGNHTVDRRNIITFAQKRRLVYTVRGVIYAPIRPNPGGKNKPFMYDKVSYESEYDSSNYFDSDLEPDGQYRRDNTPWREIGDPVNREKRNIYTRKAWLRDVPIIWWELWTEPPRDF
ncbi:uncharacterized protein LOC121868334 [Homarus americanus]|uniref:uncharacterized protein LOC121868334 n=1 Tax=Homarus americanus TaxID=6706 RepID=UPI001C44B82F|nr:uncharacterized protein LOC121868334 [Homarus americanus]